MMKKFFQSRAARLLAEFLVVSIGVYAAFSLKDYREAEGEARQLRHSYDLLIEEVGSIGFGMDMQLKNFERDYYEPFMQAMKAGEKPLPKMYYSWYAGLETGEWQEVIRQSEGEALDNGLVESVRYYRQNLGAVVKFADLLTQNCIDQLGPELVKGPDAFYDGDAHLREQYAWYPFYLDRLRQAMTDLVTHAQRLEHLLEAMKKGKDTDDYRLD